MDKKKAFTLFELLVVISIIAVLMAFLMPALRKVKIQAKGVACQSNLSQWGRTISMWATDHDEKMVSGWLNTGGGGEYWDYWTETYRPYYGREPKLLICPMASKPLLDEAGNNTGAQHPFAAWGIFQEGQWAWMRQGDFGSYGINDWTNNPPPGVNPLGEDASNCWRTTSVKGAAYVPLFLDCLWMGGFPKHTNTIPVFSGQSGGHNDGMKDYAIDRHGGSSNGLFLDFSVRTIPMKSFWRLKWHRSFDITVGPTAEDWERDAPWANKYPY